MNGTNDTADDFSTPSSCLLCDQFSGNGEICACVASPEAATDLMSQLPEMKMTLATYAVCITLGAGGNAAILLAMAAGAERKARTATNYFLISLAVRHVF